MRRQLAGIDLRRIDCLRRPADRARSLLGHALLRHALRAHGLSDRDWRYGLGPYGKPCLWGAASLEFNLSHAGSQVVCVLSSAPVGVDIEQVRAIDLGIAERFFHPREQAALMACAPSLRRDYFFRLWTAKEAYVKALGLGLQRDLASFAVLPGAGQSVALDDERAPAGALRFALADVACENGYRLALCRTAGTPLPVLTAVAAEALLA
ncbi:MAG: 4'-phosphopantetheinyl transferase superfamily protein [Duganella sp.]